MKSGLFRRKLTVGEFFCGPGGMALGASMAAAAAGIPKVEHKWAFDKDEWACKTYSRNILGGKSAIVPTDIADVNLEGLSAVDLFLFGFPCNDFSTVGESKGFNGKFGPLYSYGINYINRHRPMAFIAENVSGLIQSRNGKAIPLEIIVGEMRKAGGGYNVSPHFYKLEQYGVPQTRHRVFIVGIRNDLGITFRPPEPTTRLPAQQVSCRTAIENPPIGPDATSNEICRLSDNVVERLKLIRQGENIWAAQRLGRIPAKLSIKMTGASMSQIYRRLDPALPSYTVTGSGGGGTYVYHWEEPRALTNRERARLQTFPDSFAFDGGVAAVRQQIGMAVPPLAAATIIGALLEDLAGKKSRIPRISPNLMTHHDLELVAAEETAYRDTTDPLKRIAA